MKIIEQYLQSKIGLPLHSEDQIFVNDDFACVIDGGTSLSEIKWEGQTPGQYASKLICDSIRLFQKTIVKAEAIELISERFEMVYKKKGIFEYVKNNPLHRMFASFALYSRYHSEIWLVGDCQCLINKKVYQNKSLLGSIFAEARSVFLETEISSGKTIKELQEDDTGRKYIEPLLQRMGIFSNSAESRFAYAVIDGFKVNERLTSSLPITKSTKYLVLATDGYPKLKPSLIATESALSEILQIDPLMIGTYCSTKGLINNNVSFDDRAYLKIQL